MITLIDEGIYTSAFQDIIDCGKYGLSIINVVDVRHIVDRAGNDISYLLESIDKAKAIYREHGNVLIACDMGVSRSRVVAIGLLASLGRNIDEAISLVLTSANNPEINPDLLFLLKNHFSVSNLKSNLHIEIGDGVIVLGSKGFVGSSLLRYLENKEIPTIGLSSKDIDIKDEFIKLVNILNSISQKYVVLCAHPPSHHTAKALADSVLILKNTLEACRIANKNLIFISSMVTYLGNAHLADKLIYEADEQKNTSPYGTYSESKYLCEKLIDAYRINYGMSVLVIRPCGLYGQTMRPQWLIPKLIDKALRGETIVTHRYRNGLPSFELLYIYDLCSAISTLLRVNSNPRVVNVGSHALITTYELAGMITKLCNSSSEIKLLDISDNVRNIVTVPGYIDEIGWKAEVTLEDGLLSCINHLSKITQHL